MNTKFYTASLLALSIGAAHLAGCGDSGLVQGNAQIGSFGQASRVQSVASVDGTYSTTCLDPLVVGAKRVAGVNDTWTAAVSNMLGTQPLVVLKDPSCTLSFSKLHVLDSKGAAQTATTVTPIPLATTFANKAAVFTYTDSNGAIGTTSFYANANVVGFPVAWVTTWDANFAINVFYSDNPDSLGTINLKGSYATVTSNKVTASNVPAPNDVLDFTGVTYMNDGLGLVTSVSNTAPTLTAGNVPGQKYVITSTACPQLNLAAIATAYNGGTQHAVATATLASSDFGLIANVTTVPAQACLIIANCDAMATGVCSYQLSSVSLNP